MRLPALPVVLAALASLANGDAATVADFEAHVKTLVHFNHFPPLLEDPFKLGDTVTATAAGEAGEQAQCVLHFFEPTKSVYQLRTVSASSPAPTDGIVVPNHAGQCGLCSSLRDTAVFGRAHAGLLDLEHAGQWCVGLSALTRDWAVECYRDMGFTAPCAELHYMRALAGIKTCGVRCALAGDLSQRCYADCERETTETAFARAAGQHAAGQHAAVDVGPLLRALPAVDAALVREGDAWQQPEYGEDELAVFRSKVVLNPPPRPSRDPYADPDFDFWVDPDEVCAATFHAPALVQYSLATFASAEAALAAGAHVTHKGPCGLCSSLGDLAVYAGVPDLTTPVRRCSLKSFVSESWALRCLEDIGFSKPCADIWFFNARHTRRRCMGICLRLIREPNNLPDGSLNSCILCDEEMSGPVFKRASARTRRNSGIVSAISRPGPAVYPVVHVYPVKEPPSAASESKKAAETAERAEL